MTGRLLDALRLEWMRAFTVRSTFVLVAAAMLIGAAASALIAGLGNGSDPDPTLSTMVLTSGADLVPLPFTATFMGVLGTLAVGHDYRYGLSRALLVAQPGRSALMAARLVVLGVISAAVAGAGMVLNGGIGVLTSGMSYTLDAGVAASAVGYVLLTVLWAWLGAASTWVLRSTIPVLTVLLVVPLVVEPLLQLLSQDENLAWLRPVVHWLPFAAGRAMTAAVSAEDTGVGLGRVGGGLVFGGLVLVVLLVAWTTFLRRDA